jgi:hypothetical protein
MNWQKPMRLQATILEAYSENDDKSKPKMMENSGDEYYNSKTRFLGVSLEFITIYA